MRKIMFVDTSALCSTRSVYGTEPSACSWRQEHFASSASFGERMTR